MGDLARALIDLGRHSERRRESRRNLRESVEVVVSEMLRHLRAGDVVEIAEGDDAWRYEVERVRWNVDLLSNGEHAYGEGEFFEDASELAMAATAVLKYPRPVNTLVCWPSGAVLLDVRKPWLDGSGEEHPVAEGYMELANDDGFTTTLHQATDEEMVLFGMHSVEIAVAFREQLSGEAEQFAEAANRLTKLAPR